MQYSIPIINTTEECEKQFPSTLIISNFKTFDAFDDLYDKIYILTCAIYKKPMCKNFRIKFKFYPEDEKVYALSPQKMLINLNAWRPLVILNEVQKLYSTEIKVLDRSFMLEQMVNQRTRLGLESKVLQVLIDYGIPYSDYSKLFKTLIERYQKISIEFAALDQACIMTLESVFLNDYKNSEKIRELNNLVVPDTMQTSEVEQFLAQKNRELIAEFAKTKNPIWYISKAGNHIKDKQVQEMFISYGQIPDISGNVIPYTMKGNGFSTGYTDPATYYIAATGSRLSAIANKSFMGDAGYLARNLIILARTLTLSSTVYDCGTKHMIKYYVRDGKFLHALENKWGTETLGEPVQLIKYHTHKHLIGKHVWVRHVATCALGNECCHVCYGNDAHLVSNMPGMAIYNTEVFSEPVGQGILSTKHLLFTKANPLTFGESFSKYFKYLSGDIYINDEDGIDVKGKLSIRIEEQNLIPVNKNDTMDHNTFGSNVVFPIYVYNMTNKTYDQIDLDGQESTFIESSAMKYFELVEDKTTGKKYFEIPFDIISSEMEERFASVETKNNGMADNLHAIMDLLDTRALKYENMHELAQDFLELLLDADIRCRSVQSEIIINRMVRDANNPYERPDFSKFKEPEYVILNINQAILKTKAPTLGLSYQEVKRQILSDALYDEKDDPCYEDYLYGRYVSTDRLKTLLNSEEEETHHE